MKLIVVYGGVEIEETCFDSRSVVVLPMFVLHIAPSKWSWYILALHSQKIRSEICYTTIPRNFALMGRIQFHR